MSRRGDPRYAPLCRRRLEQVYARLDLCFYSDGVKDARNQSQSRRRSFVVGSASQFTLSAEQYSAVQARAEFAAACSRQLIVTCLRLRVVLKAGSVDPHLDIRRESRLCLEAEVALRDTVKGFADLQRRIETRPERVVLRLKQLVRDAWADAPYAAEREVRDLEADVVGWAIDGYFA